MQGRYLQFCVYVNITDTLQTSAGRQSERQESGHALGLLSQIMDRFLRRLQAEGSQTVRLSMFLLEAP